jgi:hypothetical protein
MRNPTIYDLLCLIFFVCGCTNGISVAGEYEVAPKTINDRLFIHKMKAEGRIVGSKLNLQTDSTFLYLTCGNQITGHWRKMKDSILLHVVTNVYRTASMKSINPAFIPNETITFQIRKAKLYRIGETTDSTRYVELLTKKK